MRRALARLTLVAFVAPHPPAWAGPFEDGQAAGAAANPAIRGGLSAPAAAAVVPGLTATPPETAYAGTPGLAAPAQARLAACAGATNDPVCQAQAGALASAHMPRPGLSPYDPAVAAARELAAHPEGALGSLADYYSGCRTSPLTTPAGTRPQVCQRYVGVGNYRSRRDLTVAVELTPSCAEGTWFAHGEAHRNGADVMIAEAQCRIRADGRQAFRFYAAGGRGACIDWQSVDLPTAPAPQADLVANLSPHWEGHCWTPFAVVLLPGSGCTAGHCHYTFQFGPPIYACPSGSVAGDTLTGAWGGGDPAPGPADQCFTLTSPAPLAPCPDASAAVVGGPGPQCATPAGPVLLTGASGWTLPLDFDAPTMLQHETDVWVDKTTALPAGGRCAPVGAARCVDGPGSKVIDGRAVARDCWSVEQTLTCDAGAALDACAPLVAQGCTPAASACRQTDPATGACEIYQDTYTCPVGAQTSTTVSGCPSNVFCLGTNCFNTSYTNDADFARAMSLMEAAREAGVYLDPATQQVFRGEANRCRDRLLKNCCTIDAAGAGMSNQSVFGTGSRLVFDILMNADNRQFLTQGVQALLMSGGFSGSFTTYGVTVAINGTALPASSVVLYSGEGLVVAVDPWSLAIAVVIYVVMAMSSCNEEEGKLAMKEGAGLCHSVGTYCSSCIRVLGHCVTCIEHTTGKCCFNSKLARIVNEQGRAQVGKGWGSARNPDCSGFTVAQLQALDFAAMDLAEFYASIVPTLPDVGAIQGGNAARLPTCYYGQGACR